MIEPKLTSDAQRLVDEYTNVRAKCMAFRPNVNPHAARLAELEPMLLAMAAGAKPEETVLLKGRESSVPVSACEKKRTIVKLPALFKRLGMKWISEHCKPTLKALEKSKLTDKELKRYIEEGFSETRNLGEPVATAANQAAA